MGSRKGTSTYGEEKGLMGWVWVNEMTRQNEAVQVEWDDTTKSNMIAKH